MQSNYDAIMKFIILKRKKLAVAHVPTDAQSWPRWEAGQWASRTWGCGQWVNPRKDIFPVSSGFVSSCVDRSRGELGASVRVVGSGVGVF